MIQGKIVELLKIVEQLQQRYEKYNKKWDNIREFRKREAFKAICFIGTVGLFTYMGFAKARKEFVNQKLKINSLFLKPISTT